MCRGEQDTEGVYESREGKRRWDVVSEVLGEHYPDGGVRFQSLHSPPLRSQAFVPGGNNGIMAITEKRPASHPTNQAAKYPDLASGHCSSFPSLEQLCIRPPLSTDSATKR